MFLAGFAACGHLYAGVQTQKTARNTQVAVVEGSYNNKSAVDRTPIGNQAEFTIGKDDNDKPIKVRFAPGNLYKQGDTYKFETTICYNRGDESTSKCYFTWNEAMSGSANDKSGTYSVDGYGDGWRMLTSEQWQYLIEHSKHATASVNGVNGMIIAPDGCKVAPTYNSWDTPNLYKECLNWKALQAAGCIFLPITGLFDNGRVGDVGFGGRYWSSSLGDSEDGGLPGDDGNTHTSKTCAWHLFLMADGFGLLNGKMKEGYSVRLVQDVR